MSSKLNQCKYPGKRAFTLIETVIAIGVLAVLLTAFMLVFTPAADGIKRSISVQVADRMASALETELTLLRPGESSTKIATGFDKAYTLIQDSMAGTPVPVFVYQYRGSLSDAPRDDGSLTPLPGKKDSNGKWNPGINGKDYTLVTMVRRKVQASGVTDKYLKEDLSALEGNVYAVVMNQLVFSGGQMIESKDSKIQDPTPPAPPTTEFNPTIVGAGDGYPEAVIAFNAKFYGLPSSTYSYLTGSSFKPEKLRNPYFTRNLAVRR